jgi:hypothetical protein
MFFKNSQDHQAWWCIPVIPELRRQENQELKNSLDYSDTISKKINATLCFLTSPFSIFK